MYTHFYYDLKVRSLPSDACAKINWISNLKKLSNQYFANNSYVGAYAELTTYLQVYFSMQEYPQATSAIHIDTIRINKKQICGYNI